MEEKNEDNSTDEIEVTEAMIAAGISAFVSYNPRFDLEEDAVKRIYSAMIKAARQAASA